MILKELQKIENNIVHCNKCSELIKSRLYPMPGFYGDNIKLMIIGINPGPPQLGEEDLLKSLDYDYKKHYEIGIKKCLIGKFLSKAFEKLSITWDNIFLTNIIKCATPNVRLPNKEEVANCRPYIVKQIKLSKPKNFLIMGKFPIEYLNLGMNLMEVKKINSQIITIPHPTFIRRKNMETKVLDFLSKVKLEG